MAKAAEKAGFSDLKIAAIGGDQVFQDGFMTSNAYFGCESVVEALKKGADIVLTGRLTDSALILGPAAYEFGWKMNDWNKLAAGSCAGHIVECGAQVNKFHSLKLKCSFCLKACNKLQGGVTERPAHGWCRKVQVFAQPRSRKTQVFFYTVMCLKGTSFFLLHQKAKPNGGCLKVQVLFKP